MAAVDYAQLSQYTLFMC